MLERILDQRMQVGMHPVPSSLDVGSLDLPSVLVVNSRVHAMALPNVA